MKFWRTILALVSMLGVGSALLRQGVEEFAEALQVIAVKREMRGNKVRPRVRLTHLESGAGDGNRTRI
jgi:hypothetical protein